GVRLRALDALVAARDAEALSTAGILLGEPKGASLKFRGQALAALGKLDDPRVAPVILSRYRKMEPDLQPRVIEVLTQRATWGKELLKAVAAKEVPAGAVNVNQVRQLLAS